MSKTPHIILALDTALNGCSAGVLDVQQNKSFVASRAMPRGQAEHLVPMVQDVMAQGGFTFDEIDAIVTTIGPGAFTGVRIGLSTARSFGLALDKPVFGITTLQVLARAFTKKEKPEQPFTVLVETKRKDYYAQNFSPDGQTGSDPVSLHGDAVFDMAHDLVIGDAAQRFLEEYPAYAGRYVSGYDLPDVEITVRSFVDKPELFSENPDPLYLRAPDVSQPKKKQRILASV